jgi:asparagine synthase (glutamine-hydrolysing)
VPIALDTDSISAILTLRYDPTKEPIQKPLLAADFKPQYNGKDFESKILTLIQEELMQRYKSSKFRHITLSLSGGVDSQLTLSMIRKFLPSVKVTCVSVGFGSADDEVEKAKEYARVYDCDFHELILDNVLTELPMLINIVREPRWNLYHYYTFEYGIHRSNVFYTGDGGDELFGGYTFRYHKFMSLYRGSANWRDQAKLYLSCHERDWVPDQDKMFGEAIDFSWEKIYALIKPYFQNHLDPLNQVFLADFNGKLLFDWLPTNVAFAKNLGIEIRSLFLSDKMIDFAFRLPWERKYDPVTRTGKIPLRSILNRQKGMNNSNDISKKGFSVGLDLMWNKNAREITTKCLSKDSEIVKNKLIDPEWLISAIDSLRKGSSELNPRYINKMLSLLALEVWYRLFVSRTMKPNEKL